MYVFENNIPPMCPDLHLYVLFITDQNPKKNIGQAILVGKCCHCRINSLLRSFIFEKKKNLKKMLTWNFLEENYHIQCMHFQCIHAFWQWLIGKRLSTPTTTVFYLLLLMKVYLKITLVTDFCPSNYHLTLILNTNLLVNRVKNKDI